jgi:hypothetical protein
LASSRESDIPAKGEAAVDVVMIKLQPLFIREQMEKPGGPGSEPPTTPRIVLLSADDPAGPVKITAVEYGITICVFPVAPSEGSAVREKFGIIPNKEAGTVELRASGIAPEAPSNHAG